MTRRTLFLCSLLCLRSDGRTLLSGGADGWIHTWVDEDGKVSVKGRPTTMAGQGFHEKKVSSLLRKLAAAGEKNGPYSWQIASPYKN
jgi:WD40 repeat protein